jgi:acetyl-CoA acyltransferase
MSAVIHAHRAVAAGDGDVFIAGGVEGMTRAPWVIGKTSKPFGTDAQMFDSSFGWRFVNPKMHDVVWHGRHGHDRGKPGRTICHQSGRSRPICILESAERPLRPVIEGLLAEEIAPRFLSQKGKTRRSLVEHDEFIKPDTTLEVLAKLRPAFKKEGSVTAGNASGLNDGAAALLIASENGLKTSGYKAAWQVL